MNFFQFIGSKQFWRHFLLSVALSGVIIILVISTLKWYTHHGESVVVPNLVGLTPDQISQLETISDVEIIVVDSVFDSRMPRGSVLIQDPVAGSKVKRHRKVYLTTVAVTPEKVDMPDLVDLTLRQAAATLETYGLRLGKISYVPDIAENAILAQSFEGKHIEPGAELPKGSVIDLRVGQSFSGGRSPLPFLIGKTREEAISLLNKSLLTLGEETFENEANPETARVYSQSPAFTSGRLLNPGQSVSLVFKDPATFDFETYLNQISADTLSADPDSLTF